MTLYEIVMKLVGSIIPAGDSRIDAERLANLRELTELMNMLLFDIHNAASYSERQEWSMKAIGQHAKDFLRRCMMPDRLAELIARWKLLARNAYRDHNPGDGVRTEAFIDELERTIRLIEADKVIEGKK